MSQRLGDSDPRRLFAGRSFEGDPLAEPPCRRVAARDESQVGLCRSLLRDRSPRLATTVVKLTLFDDLKRNPVFLDRIGQDPAASSGEN